MPHFDADLSDVAEFALWFRSLAPASEPLLFCDEAMNGSLELVVNHRALGAPIRRYGHLLLPWVLIGIDILLDE